MLDRINITWIKVSSIIFVRYRNFIGRKRFQFRKVAFILTETKCIGI